MRYCWVLLAVFASRGQAQGATQDPDAWYRTFTTAVAKGDTAAVHRMTTSDYTFLQQSHVYTQAERLANIAERGPTRGPTVTIT